MAGKNYGWPVATLGTHYSTYDWPNHAAEAKPSAFEPQTFAWVPSIGVSNLIEVALEPGRTVSPSVRLRADAVPAAARRGRPRDLSGHPDRERLRHIAALPDGRLVLWTDEAKLIFLSIDRAKLAANHRPIPW